MENTGRPEVMRTSTSTGRASMPTNASVEIWPYMPPPNRVGSPD